MEEVCIESKGSKGSRMMVESSNKIMTKCLALHMVQRVRNIAVSVRRGGMGWRGPGGVQSRVVAMGVVVALCVTWVNRDIIMRYYENYLIN